MNDQFAGDWESYLKIIEESDVRVLGATDYCSLEGYRALKQYKLDGRLPGVELLLPNLEFRLNPVTAKSKAINLHLLVNPEPEDHLEKLTDALGRLTMSTGRRAYPCTRIGFLDLGGQHCDSSDTDAVIRAGIGQFKISVETFRKWVESEHWIRQNCLVGVAGGNDGLAGLRKDGGFKAIHDDLVAFSDFIFSAQPSDRKFYVGDGGVTEAVLRRKFGGLRACLHGSDAHDLSRLLKPNLDRKCWIKSAPTFDGLRQAVLEPRERVWIGSDRPRVADPDQVITSVKIGGSDWFTTGDVSFGPGLTAVIGSKGSGKTALADLIALACGSWDSTPHSFLAKAGKHLKGLRVEVGWGSGRESSMTVGSDFGTEQDVRYLSQHFVEKLCSRDHLAGELVGEIERVVFDHISEADGMGCVSFDELRLLRTGAIRSERVRLGVAIERAHSEIAEIQANARRCGGLREQLRRAEAGGEEIRKQLRELREEGSDKDKKTLELLGDVKKQREELEGRVAVLRRELETLKSAQSRLNGTRRDVASWLAELSNSLGKLGASDGERGLLTVEIAPTADTLISKLKDEKVLSLKALDGTEEAPPGPETIAGLKSKEADLEKSLDADQRRRKLLGGLQRRLMSSHRVVSKLKREIREFSEATTTRLPEIVGERDENVLLLFQQLVDEKRILEELYLPVAATLGRDEESALLEFSVDVSVDVGGWCSAGEMLLDLRREGLEVGVLAQHAEHCQLNSAIQGMDAASFMSRFLEFKSRLIGAGIHGKLRDGIERVEFARWLYSMDHVTLEYGLRYRNTELRLLSSGQRGIVLLILYLALDVSDHRPLIVDQPEENLDNASVYSVLVSYFRRAKHRRQVIVVTHNPNLVVNVDAECVVVATGSRDENGFPRISYREGPIEAQYGQDPASPESVRSQVCAILEGGREAFKKREIRYQVARRQS
jgi:energy-coupling factor transporter ATP-binding protein EcfA2